MRSRVVDGSMIVAGVLLLLAAALPWDGLTARTGGDVLVSRTANAWDISPLCWVPLVLGTGLAALWFVPRSAEALWRRLPAVVYGSAFLGLVAVFVGLATGPSDDYGWHGGTPLTGDPDVVSRVGWTGILLALAGLVVQLCAAGLTVSRARRRVLTAQRS